MVEFFGQEWNDANATHTITLTSAQKEEIAKYDFIVTTNTQHYPARAGAAQRVTCVFYVPHLLDFFNNSIRYDMYFGTGAQSVPSSSYLTPYFVNNSNIAYQMSIDGSGSIAGTSELKFYGIKL